MTVELQNMAAEIKARQAKDTQLVEDAIEIKKRAERRTAEMIETEREAGKLAPAHRPNKGNSPVTLSGAGISKMQASRWGKVAPSRMSEEQFEKHVEESKLAVRRSLEPAADGMDVHYSSESPEWYTPPEIIKRTERTLGKIDLDPRLGAQGSRMAKDLRIDDLLISSQPSPWSGAVGLQTRLRR